MEIPDHLLNLSQHYPGARLGGTRSQVFFRRVDQPAPFTSGILPGVRLIEHKLSLLNGPGQAQGCHLAQKVPEFYL